MNVLYLIITKILTHFHGIISPFEPLSHVPSSRAKYKKKEDRLVSSLVKLEDKRYNT